MKHLLLIISGITLGSSALYFWYCEMFSDGFVGWFSRAFNRTRWKNFIALSQPAGGLFFVFGALALVGPMIDPEWMYPEYHAAKREEQRRREAAERGESEDRNPFLDDNGVYTSQLGNVPVDIPEAVGPPSTGDPPPLQGPPETEEPALYDSDTTDAFDITATTAALPHTGAPTSNGARPARASCAYRGPQEDRDTAVAHSTAEQAARIEE